jgi:OST-HTH/LOTUS domain-containing protein
MKIRARAVVSAAIRRINSITGPDRTDSRNAVGGQPDPHHTNGADAEEPEPPDPQAAATGLLTRALRIGLEKDDVDWLHNSAVKAQMKRMDPSFSEKSLGFKSFSDFLRSRSDLVELDESSTTRMVRLRPDG